MDWVEEIMLNFIYHRQTDRHMHQPRYIFINTVWVMYTKLYYASFKTI